MYSAAQKYRFVELLLIISTKNNFKYTVKYFSCN